MYLLGIHIGGHDSAAALVKEGKVLFAIEEERLARVKHIGGFPLKAIQECLDHENLKINDIDTICFSFNYPEHVRKKILGHTLKYYPKANNRFLGELDYIKLALNFEDHIREKLDYQNKVFFCHHHTAHMASSYYLSRFQESALFSIDGVGDIESSVIGEGLQNEVKIFEKYSINYPDSIGLLYTAITDYLGFIPHCDEGKVMGLAPYGNSEIYKEHFQDIVYFNDDGMYEFNLDYFEYPFKMRSSISEKFLSVFGPARKPKSEITRRHKDIAAILQYITEKAMLHTAQHLYKITSSKNLCLAGGTALNCVANGRILTKTPFENIFVQPAANDAGTAIGSALYCYYSKHGDNKRHPLNNSYLGTGFSNSVIKSVIEQKKIQYSENDDLFVAVAKLLSEGKIVGWFNGRMEFGPRSLGNRSILCSPFPAEMKDILNSKVKHREGFRPFAPSVLLEDCSEYFDNSHESPYMLLTYNVNDKYIERMPAVTHADKTARVQTVVESENPEFFRLISEYKKITGIGVLLNTSFNVMGQPIVCRPEEAIECFLTTHIDYLVMNAKYILSKD